MFEKGIRMKAWHKQQKRMFVVRSIIGLDTGQPVIQTPESTISMNDVDMLLHIEKKDKENQPIFNADILRYEIKEDKKTIIVLAYVKYEDCRFKLLYDKELGEDKKKATEIVNPNWEKTKVIANIFQPPKVGW